MNNFLNWPLNNMMLNITIPNIQHVLNPHALLCSTTAQSNQWQPRVILRIPNVINNTVYQTTSNMESPKQYIRKTSYRDTDQWSVYFTNKSELSVDEIDEIVSKFVTKKKVNQPGSKNGMCFINLFSFEDAVKCVEGLQGHESIQLKKQLIKNRGEADKNTTINDETNNNNSNYDEMYKSINIQSDVADNYGISDNSYKNGIKSNDEESIATSNSVDVKKSSETFNEVLTDLKAKQVIDPNTYNYLNQEFQEKKYVEDETKMPELVLKKISSNPISNCNLKQPVEESPKLIENVEAEEIIVANIHEDYGTNFILHLLEKYQPIGATPVKISERYALRYCHVYFTSNQYINEVQKKFDKFELGTKNLIVLYVNNF